MRNLIYLMLALCLIYAGCGSKSVVEGPDRYMDVDDLKPGMKGFGKTVFKGAEIETFDVEILGVVKNWSPNKDIILAQISHPVTDHAGIIAGMSGSPIYVNGKLIGALAYGWSFQNKPITGITPIKQMLVFKQAEKNTASAKQGSELFAASAPDNDPAAMRPLAVPLIVSGASPEFRAFIKSKIKEETGKDIMMTVGGQASGDAYQVPGDLEEGSAIAVKLIDGDLSIAAVGTVTCVEGDTVYGFGHPFYGEGNVKLPMAKAWVHTVISSLYSSFKMASPAETVGTIDLDFADGIRGQSGSIPSMIPMTAEIESIDTGMKESHSFELVDEKSWTPFMALLAAYYSMGNSSLIGLDNSYWIESTINAEGLDPIKGKDFFTSMGNPGFSVAYPFNSKIAFLMDNHIKPVKIKSIDLKVRFKSGKLVKRIVRYIVDKTDVKPGDDVEVIVYTVRYGEKEKKEILNIHIPEDIPEGSVQCMYYNGMDAWGYDIRRAPGLGRPETIEQVAKLMSDKYDANTMILDFNVPEGGLVIEGEEYEDIPDSIRSLYAGLGNGKYTTTGYRLYKRSESQREEVMVGTVSIVFNVSKYN